MNKTKIIVFLGGICLLTVCSTCIIYWNTVSSEKNRSLENTYINQTNLRNTSNESDSFPKITIQPKDCKYKVNVMHDDNSVSERNIESIQFMINSKQDELREHIGNPLFIYTKEDMESDIWIYKIGNKKDAILLCYFKNKVFLEYDKLEYFIGDDIFNIEELSKYINENY